MNISQLLASYESQLKRADMELKSILDGAKAQNRSNLTPDESKRSDTLLDNIEGLRAKISEAKRVQAEEADYEARVNDTVPANLPNRQHRTSTVSVTRNERTYRQDTDPDGRQFLLDVANNFLYQSPASSERLQRHLSEERVERPGAMQERTTGDVATTNWAGLVVPQYLVDFVAPQISNLRPFADACCVHHNLPEAGMVINYSKVTTGSAVALQSAELAAVTS